MENMMKNPFEEEDKDSEIVQMEDFSQQPSFVEGENFQKSKSLSAAENTLSQELSNIQTKMDEIRQRKQELGESQAEQAEKARLNILTADLQDAANTIGGISSDFGTRERTQAEKEAMGLQKEGSELESQLSELEELERGGRREQVGLIGKEEEEIAAQKQIASEQELQMMKSDPNSSISQEARATAELVLGQGAIPPDVSASQLEQVYPDILENARYMQKQGDEFAKIQMKQEFEMGEAEKERIFKAEQEAKKQAFDMSMQNQKLNEAAKAGQKDLKSNQALSAGFGRRMEQANLNLEKLLRSGYNPAGYGAFFQSKMPEMFKSEEQKLFEQAQRNFINATLRRESGAAIADSEFVSAEKQYFPQINDTPAVIEQKAKNRAQVIAAMRGEAGEAWERIQRVDDLPDDFDQQAKSAYELLQKNLKKGSDDEKSASEKLDSGEMPTRKKFVPGQGMAQTSSGRRIFGGG